METAMTSPLICPSSVPITVAAVPVATGGAPLTGKTLWSICHVQSSPGSRADQLILKLEGLGAGVCAKATPANRKRKARAGAKGCGLRTVMVGLQTDWPRFPESRANEKWKRASAAPYCRRRRSTGVGELAPET